jgi:cyclopropane fatty-acyl-phospholipid synthase-like methyltransferase
MTQEENEIMSAYTVVFDHLVHLGPGDSATTRNLAERLCPDLPPGSRVADFGCGVGASALVLAQSLPKARVLALDSHAPFIARLETAANARGLGEHISAVVGDMVDPPSLDGVMGGFDLIWSESAIYSIGRTNAFTYWRPLLRPGGWLVFSDTVWQCEPTKRSNETSAFWAKEYPDIATADAVVDELTAAGFNPLDPVLSGRKPWSNYYEPLRDRLRLLVKRQNRPQALIDVMAELEREIDVYDCAGDDVALSFFLARRDSIPE